MRKQGRPPNTDKHAEAYYLKQQGLKRREMADLTGYSERAVKYYLGEAYKLIKQGQDPAEFAERGRQALEVRGIELNIVGKEGQEERKPDVQDMGDHYRVTTGKREIVISKDNLRELKQLYCEQHLTINQVCRKLDMPRPDFHAIKTAFGVTHDDVPYLDEDLQNNDIDELAEQSIQRQKAQYFLKLQEKEIDKLKKEVADYRKQDYFLDRLNETIMEHMAEFARNYTGPPKPIPVEGGGEPLLLEIPPFDLHLGKLAWKPETGENYDHKIARARFEWVIEQHLKRIQQERKHIERILFPFGNDFFNFDTIEGTTSAGTPQDTDLRWQKLSAVGEEMLVRAIDVLSQIAPVDVLYVPGNHDKAVSYHALRFLWAWYKDSERVNVNPDVKTRKYYEYGVNLVGFTHGDKEGSRIFGNMQVEAPKAWGRTQFREWHCGHLHSEQVKEQHGVKVRRLSGATGTDAWHGEHGYVGAIAQHVSFLWSRERGPHGTWMFNIR